MSANEKASLRNRAIKTGLLIILLGPLVGSITLFVALSVFSVVSADEPLRNILTVPYSILLAVMTAPVAYILGGPFAGIAAVLTSVWLWRGNAVGYGTAVALAMLSCCIALAGSQLLAAVGAMDGGLVLGNLALVGPVAIVTALALCWLSRRLGWC